MTKASASASRGGPGLGVGYWTDGTDERIVYVTRGYTMFSLDAKTGLPDPALRHRRLGRSAPE